MATVQVFGEHCKHCRLNPKAEKPYAKMKRLRHDELSAKLAELSGKKLGVDQSCIRCYAVRDFIGQKE